MNRTSCNDLWSFVIYHEWCILLQDERWQSVRHKIPTPEYQLSLNSSLLIRSLTPTSPKLVLVRNVNYCPPSLEYLFHGINNFFSNNLQENENIDKIYKRRRRRKIDYSPLFPPTSSSQLVARKCKSGAHHESAANSLHSSRNWIITTSGATPSSKITRITFCLFIFSDRKIGARFFKKA